jgi:hypothetical protein
MIMMIGIRIISNTWFDIGGAEIEEDIEAEKEVYHDIYVPHHFLPSTVEIGSAKDARARTHAQSEGQTRNMYFASVPVLQNFRKRTGGKQRPDTTKI